MLFVTKSISVFLGVRGKSLWESRGFVFVCRENKFYRQEKVTTFATSKKQKDGGTDTTIYKQKQRRIEL